MRSALDVIVLFLLFVRPPSSMRLRPAGCGWLCAYRHAHARR